MNKPLKIFITYARTDKEAKDKLIKSLAVMKRGGLIEIWHDTEMLGGDRWQQEIFSKHLPTSDLLLYLVSADSLASENCYEELEVALEKKIRVVPIIFSDCDWRNDQLSNFQVFPDDGTPINEWDPESKGWQNVVEGIQKVVAKMQIQSDPHPGISDVYDNNSVYVKDGNRIKKEIQEKMKHVFISYVHENMEMVDQLYETLTSQGIKVWLDRNDIEPGVRWKQAIREAIQQGIFFIACFSKEYNNRGETYMNQEVIVAIESLRQKSIDQSWFIPIKLNECEIPDFDIGAGQTLNDLQHVELYKDWNIGIQILLRVIQSESSEGMANGDTAESKINQNVDAQFSKESIDTQLLHQLKFCCDPKISPIMLADHSWKKNQLIDTTILLNNGASITDWPDESRGQQTVIARVRKEIDEMSEVPIASSDTFDADLLTDSLFKKGKVLMRFGRIDPAIAAYSQVIESNQDHPDLYFYRGLCYWSKNEIDSAINDYNAALRLNPNLIDVYFCRGNAYLERGAIDDAINDYNVVIHQNPEWIHAYYNRGSAHRRKLNHDIAIEDFHKVVELEPNFAEVYYNRGNAYWDKGEIDEAIQDYTVVIDLDSNFADAYYNRGNAYQEKNEIDEAIQDYFDAIGLNPNFADAYYNRGNAYRDKGEIDKAIEDYTRTIELSLEQQDIIKAYYNRGNAYQNIGEIEKAIEDYTRTIELDQNFADAYYNRGNAYLEQDAINKALNDYSTVINQNPNDAKVYFYRGTTYWRTKQVDAALNDYNKAIELNPEIAEAYFYRGIACWYKDEIDNSINDYNKAIELNPEIAEAYFYRGNFYLHRDEIERAIDDYGRAIELNPQIAEVYVNRGNIYLKQDRIERAIDDYDKAIELNLQIAEVFINRGYVYYHKGEIDKGDNDFSKVIELDPSYGDMYSNYAIFHLHKQNWTKAKIYLRPLRGMDLISSLLVNEGYQNIEDFEQTIGIQLPEDIVVLLTPS